LLLVAGGTIVITLAIVFFSSCNIGVFIQFELVVNKALSPGTYDLGKGTLEHTVHIARLAGFAVVVATEFAARKIPML
jgi:hypothetical protein